MLKLAEFWSYLIERENIRLRRLAGLPRDQWTQDPIMRAYSFTNAQRYHDRTTIGLKQIYDTHLGECDIWDAETSITTRDGAVVSTVDVGPDPRVILLNCGLYRFFGTVEMAKAIGWRKKWEEDDILEISNIAASRMAVGQKVFTSSYIVPNCGLSIPKHEVVCGIMSELYREAWNILDTRSWEVMCDRLCELNGFGPFMAKEVSLDFYLAMRFTPDDWQTWSPVGPGGRRGASRVMYGQLEKISNDEALTIIRMIYASRSTHWTHDLMLDLHAVQFALCEFDKFSRVAEGRRPKRNFNPTVDEVTCRPE
jgi:5-hmdU DNA kinase-like protein